MNTIGRSSLILAVSFVMGLSACGKKEEPATPKVEAPKVEAPKPPEEMVVKIGSVAPLTGPQAHLGKDNENGAKLALEEANAAGIMIEGKKVKFDIISEDDQADPKTATIVAQKLVDMKVSGVIGHLNSGATIPASKIYNDAGIPQISPSATNPKYTQQGFKGAFRVITNDVQQGKVLGEYATKNLKVKKVAIIDDRTAYGQGLADEFEKAAKSGGAKIVTREFTTDKSTDFLAILTTIKGKKPDLIFYGGMDAQAGPMVKQMKSLGIKSQFLGGDGAQSAEFLKLAGPDAEGVMASSPGLPLDRMPKGKEFMEKYTSKYGQIQIYAPYAYDAASAMVEAIKRAGSTDPAKYLPELAKMDMPGVTGQISFDENGDIKGGAVTVYKVEKGAWMPLETLGETAAAPAAAAAGSGEAAPASGTPGTTSTPATDKPSGS